MKEHMSLLGLTVRDTVTGFKGVVTTIGFDIYGCVQAIVTPQVNEKGEQGDGRWFDSKRLVVLNKKPVMDIPTFAAPGGGDNSKPVLMKKLAVLGAVAVGGVLWIKAQHTRVVECDLRARLLMKLRIVTDTPAKALELIWPDLKAWKGSK